jgi:hypothetical protein
VRVRKEGKEGRTTQHRRSLSSDPADGTHAERKRGVSSGISGHELPSED